MQCRVPNCEQQSRAWGMCEKHFKAAYHKETYKPKLKAICRECGAEHWGKNGMCGKCYEVWYRTSSLRKAALAKHAQTDAFKKTQRKWIDANTKKKQALVNAYRHHLRQRTPAWADQGYLTLFYEIAQLETERTGRVVEVDHIIPLRGKKVSGLHVEHNLQLLFKSDNSSKGNRIQI